MEKLKYIYFNPLLDIYSKKDLIKECSASITYSNENENLLELDKGKSVDPTKPHLFSITNVPAYFNVNYYKNEAYSIKKYPSVNGYAICLDDYTDVESYMGQHLKRKVKGNILRGVRRLEQCFEITYKRFNGDIERYEYERIMAILKEMIIKRFK